MSKLCRFVSCVAAVLLAAVSSVRAQVVDLPAPGADCVANGNALRNAIDSLITAGTGGTINVPEGVYCFDRPWRLDGLTNEAFTGTRTINGVGITINGVQTAGSSNPATPANLVIRRQAAPDLPVGVSPNFRLFNVETGGTLEIIHATLCNGQAGQGGAIRAVGGTELKLTDCIVQDNNSFTRGGGLFVQNVGLAGDQTSLGLDLQDVRFFRNVAQNGFGGGASIEGSNTQLRGCIFSCNQALGGDDADGGGLYFNNGGDPGAQTKFFALLQSPLTRSLFTCNAANSEGGGLFINGGTSDPDGTGPAGTLPSEVDFFGNRAGFQGGGLYTQATSVEFDGCTFGGLSPTLTCLGANPGAAACTNTPGTCGAIGEANQAPRGGGVMNVTSQAIFRRCKFVGNRAISPGGGRAGGAGSSGGTNAYIECCFINNIAAEDFAGNTPANSRGGGSDAEFGSPMYNDCLFKGNEAANGGGISISGQGKDTTTLIYNCQITQNVGSVAGGGIAVLGDASPRILHSTIARNRASRIGVTPPASTTSGTGVHCGGSLSLPTLINSIVTQNQRGTGVVNGSFSYGYPPALGNTDFRGATAVKASFSFVDVGANLQYPDTVPGGAVGSNVKGCWKPGTTGANFDDNDPSFESSGIDGMNVHLQCNSPCIDHANYVLARGITQFLIGLGSVSPIPEARGQRGEVGPIDTSDPAAVATFITDFLKDYDDTAATSGNNENCTGLGTGQDRDNTCRPLQCQSDMGADEARTDIVITPFANKVVCLGRSQSFTATGNCAPPGSPAIPLLFQWFRVDPVTCVETLVNGLAGYTVVTTPDGTSSTLTISAAAAADNAIFRVRVTRGQYLCNGANIFLPTVPLIAPFTSCGGSTCPVASCQARLFVVDPPTAGTTGDKTVCRNGSQCIEFNFGWALLPPTNPLSCLLFPEPTDPRFPCNGSTAVPPACTPTISYTYQASPATQAVPFTGNARASITCDPDVVVGNRVTRNCRIRFTNPEDCDSGRYCATINCNLPDNKCLPATACANLCVTPPPTAGGDTTKNVCVTGNQSISLFADFANPATCATPWCPTPACIRTVQIIKRVTGQPDVALPIGQTGRVAVTCSPINTGTRVNCTVTFTGAQPSDCAQYCIFAGCSNLGDAAACGGTTVDKCGEATWCANLCVLDPLMGSGDPAKTVCRTGTQTIALSMMFPVGNCVFCTPTSCTPSVVVSRKRTADAAFAALSQTTPRTDTITGQGTSTTSVTCQPFDPATRKINCVVTVTNANDANCAEYRISGNCSNLPAADKCTGDYTTNLCVALPPTAAAPVPEKTVCLGGNQQIDLTATFPLSTCAFCSPTSCTPRFTIIKRPVSGADITLPVNGSLGNATVTCDPFNTTTRTQNCRVSIANASLDDCGRYCIRAECDGLPVGKCTPAEACTALCVVPLPVTTSDPDKTVCFGNSQLMNFRATFPRGLCAVTTGCPTACTPSVVIIKKLPNGTEAPLVTGGHATVVCDPTSTLPNGDREINCRVTINNADDTDCANYCIRATCGNLTGTNKCTAVESCTKLCIVPNPTLTIDPTKTVCEGGRQNFGFAVTFPAFNCTAFCPTEPCVGSFQVVKRASCTATGGENIPVNPVGTPPRVYVTCDPFNATTRTYNCRLNVTNAVAADCAAYVVRAASCPDLVAAGKCAYREVCTTLCVVPSPTASGDSTQRVCVGGNQTIALQGFFPNPNCTFCPTSPAPCTPRVTIVRRFPGGAEEVLYDPTNPPPAVPRISVVCNPPASVTGGRAVNCTVTVTGAQPNDCAQYCVRATCGNLLDGKCGTAEFCSSLCVLPPPAPGGDPSKSVCYRGNQTINLYADFPIGDCTYCTPESCTPNVVIKRRSTSGAEVTLPIGGTRSDTTGGITSTTSITCSAPTGPNRRINCVVTVNNANDANCGSYCIQASCSNLATGKCATREFCSTLCILPTPTASAETANVCVCLGGCQEIRFTARFPLPNCSLPGCNADTCQRGITIYKLVGGTPVPLTEGPGNGQYTCDPINASRDVVCRVRIGRTATGGCDGAVEGDAGRYCMDVTCGGLTEGKCSTATACTDLSVYERPCPSEISDYKVCVGGDLCIPFTFTTPACCQASIVIKKNGQPVTLGAADSTTAKYRLIGTGGNRQFCIRNLENSDDGNYEVCVSCSNLVADKNCSCCEPFCLDVLTPPEVAVDLRTRSVCVGQPIDFNFCFSSDLMLCPPSGTPDPTCLTFPSTNGMRVPVRYRFEKLTDPAATLPSNDANCTIGPAVEVPFTLTPVPNGTICANQYRLSIPALSAEQCGIYRLSAEYCGIDPVGVCRDCVYFEIKCGTVNVCLKGRDECPGVPVFLCPRFPDYANCVPDPYVIRPYTFPYDYTNESNLICNDPRVRCLTFQWFRQREGEPGFTAIPLSENPTAQSCCLDLGVTDPEDVACYFVRVTTRTDGDCADQAPCDPVDSPTACVTIKPPEECCWCVDCCWDNGRRELVNGNGVLSMKPVHGEFPEIKAAADFYLCGEQFYQIKKFAGSMLIRQNTALPYKAKLTLFEDCDGCPGEMIKMWDLTEYCVVGEVDATGLQPVDFTFDFTSEKLWLRGGRTYWWSLQGISEINTPNYEAYWVTSQAASIMGSVPKKMEVGVDNGWRPLDECCIDCVELAFCIECDSCKIIYDGGEPEPCATAGGTRSEKSVSTVRNSRAADQFVTPPFIKAPATSTDECDFLSVDWMVCYIEGYIYTNCNSQSFVTWLEIYGNDCDNPNWSLVGQPGYRFRADKIEPLDCYATIDGVSNLRLYKVRFCPVGSSTYPMGLYLRGGRNYWLSLAVEDTFNQNQRAYFAWKSDDCTDCPVKFNPGQQIAPGRNLVRWTDVGHDFAFVIAAKNVPFDLNVPAPVVDPVPTCPADTNRDGRVSVQDMFDFLNAWFAGCP